MLSQVQYFECLHKNLPSELSSATYKFKIWLPKGMALCTLFRFTHQQSAADLGLILRNTECVLSVHH